MFDGLLNPALAAGVALAAVPLIIHLLNRRRHRPLAFGAMRFVIAAYRRTRRRAQMESLLLLLLRMGAVALLAFALARPFSGGDGPLAVLTETRRDLLLVVDASASTGYREHVESVFQRIVERARDHVSGLDGPRGDRVRIVLAGETPRLIAWRTPEEALSVLATLDEPSHAPLDLAKALAEVRRVLASEGDGEGAGVDVRLLTDLQRRAFLASAQEDDADGDADWRTELDALAAVGVRLIVEDLGAAEATPPNLGILDVRATEPILGPGLPLEIEVVVANHGAAAALTRVALALDGQRLPARPLEIPPRSSARALFSVAFPSPGAWLLEGSLEGDRLAFDDRRAQVVHVPPPVRVLAVNGAPAPHDIERDALGLVLAALMPFDIGDGDPTAFSPFVPTEIDAAALASEDVDLSRFDVIVAAGMETFTGRGAERLRDRVLRGAGLVLVPGPATVPQAWNERLFAADGSGLLPARLGRTVAVSDRRESYWRVQRFDEDHPALSFFAETRWRPLLVEVPVYEFVAARPLEDARVVATLDDDASSPFLIERSYGRGRVILLTTSLDPSWNRIALSARTLVPFVHELLRHAARREPPRRTVQLGEPVVARFEAFPREVTLLAPGGERRSLGAAARQVDDRFELDPVAGLWRAGAWRFEAENGERVAFAVQADAREGDLERLGAAELAKLHPALLPLDRSESSGDGVPDLPRRGELWRPIAFAALLFVVLDSLFAAWLGRRRARA